MTDLNKIIDATDEAQRYLRAHSSAIEAALESMQSPALRAAKDIVNRDTVTGRMMLDIERQQAEWRRLTEVPLAALRESGFFDATSSLQQELARVQESLAPFKDRFYLPEIDAAARIMADLDSGPLADVMARYAVVPSTVEAAMAAMRTPWLDCQDAVGSASRFATVQGIGAALACMPSFCDSLTNALRLDLGDWRDPIASNLADLADTADRDEFFSARGFDRELTALPVPAFRQCVSLARLDTPPPRLADAYGSPVPVADEPEDEEGFIRTNEAHGWLFQLETHLRAFIDAQMSLMFGADWYRTRLPRDVHERLVAKKQEREKAGAPARPLLAYADFTDYEKIICRKDNWREVFSGFFVRQESIRESFQRLYPIRVDTMHARPITQDDALLLYVETRRLIRVIVVE